MQVHASEYGSSLTRITDPWSKEIARVKASEESSILKIMLDLLELHATTHEETPGSWLSRGVCLDTADDKITSVAACGAGVARPHFDRMHSAPIFGSHSPFDRMHSFPSFEPSRLLGHPTCMTGGVMRTGSYHVVHDLTPEEFIVTAYPASPVLYWQEVIKSGSKVGIQLEIRGENYHLLPGQTTTVADSKITCLAEETLYPGVKHRIYTIQESDTKERLFHHYTFEWPDFSTPSPQAMYQLMRAYKSHISVGTQVYVHCRGGIGRSGTFVFAAVLCNSDAKDVNPAAILRELRTQRPGFVETIPQEKFAIDFAQKFREISDRE